VNVSPAVIADQETFEVVEPGKGTFDHPTIDPETGAVLGPAPGDEGFDTSLSHLSPVAVMVVAPVTKETIGPAPRTTDEAANRGYAVHEGHELGHIVAVATGHRVGEGQSGGVDQDVMFRAPAPAVNRARARLGAPFFACTWLPSTTARDQSISPEARSLVSRSRWRSSHTPASCHSSMRRQQVIPEPKPSSSGRCRQAMPVCKTNRMPERAWRSESRLRPGDRNRRSLRGRSGSTSSHSSSETTHGFTAIGSLLSQLDATGFRNRRGGSFILKPVLSRLRTGQIQGAAVMVVDHAL